jgi:hypothetical protein
MEAMLLHKNTSSWIFGSFSGGSDLRVVRKF